MTNYAFNPLQAVCPVFGIERGGQEHSLCGVFISASKVLTFRQGLEHSRRIYVGKPNDGVGLANIAEIPDWYANHAGLAVLNLLNPASVTPVRLADQDLVEQIVHGTIFGSNQCGPATVATVIDGKRIVTAAYKEYLGEFEVAGTRTFTTKIALDSEQTGSPVFDRKGRLLTLLKTDSIAHLQTLHDLVPRLKVSFDKTRYPNLARGAAPHRVQQYVSAALRYNRV